MSFPDARRVPLDETSSQRLRAAGLTYRVIDMDEPSDAEGFLRAEARGFLESEPKPQSVAQLRVHTADRRNIGVFEPAAPAGAWPIATINGVVMALTVPGGEVGMWAISAVTVAGTHRRRGVARALVEGELRAAAAAGVAVAGLTASEATIYGRYGFASAIPVAEITVDTRRAGWVGPASPGRLEYVDPESLAADLATVHERSRRDRAGQVPGWPGRWLSLAGLAQTSDDDAAAVRGVRYLDEAGEVRGVLVYTLRERGDSSRFDLVVRHLGSADAPSLRALWQFAVQHDLVERVLADLRPLDDPITWLVADQRAVRLRVHDHEWLRILDLPAALSARTYRAPGELILAVDDELGFTAGAWSVRIDDDGRMRVDPAELAEATVRLNVAELSALYAGGVTASTLRAAGRLHATEEATRLLDDAFRASESPLLGIWY